MIGLERWGLSPSFSKREAKKEDVLPLENTVQRYRKLIGIFERFTNVHLRPADLMPHSPDEWVLVVDVSVEWDGKDFFITFYALGTADKATALRRVYGWGLRNKRGELCWPEVCQND